MQGEWLRRGRLRVGDFRQVQGYSVATPLRLAEFLVPILGPPLGRHPSAATPRRAQEASATRTRTLTLNRWGASASGYRSPPIANRSTPSDLLRDSPAIQQVPATAALASGSLLSANLSTKQPCLISASTREP
jgi:hypothetical protein